MSELSPLPDTPLGLYRLYKGGEYQVHRYFEWVDKLLAKVK